MKILSNIILASILVFCTMADAQENSVNIKTSKINWTGKAAFSNYSQKGNLNLKSGKIKIQNDTIHSLEIVVNMRSLYHKNKDLNSHLRGKDFFEVKKYQTAEFTITEPVKIENGVAKIEGKMTIKNITKTEKFTLSINDNYNSLRFEISIDRTKYGVKFNSPNIFKKLKENAIADQFRLEGNLYLD